MLPKLDKEKPAKPDGGHQLCLRVGATGYISLNIPHIGKFDLIRDKSLIKYNLSNTVVCGTH